MQKFSALQKYKVQHLTQEDKGFRKSKILNKAVAKITSDYIIQIDGDCIPHKNFIKNHVKRIKRKKYLYGTRVFIKEEYVNKLIDKKKIRFSFFSKYISNKRLRNLYLPFLSIFFSSQKNISKKFRGCNVSFWRDDFIAVNGYNEDFEGWGMEDSELMIRFHNNGIKGKRIKFCGIVYHLDHPNKDLKNYEKNMLIQKKSIEKKIIKTTNGVDKYL